MKENKNKTEEQSFPRILLATNDLTFETSLHSKTLIKNPYISIRSYMALKKIVKENSFKIVVIDEDICSFEGNSVDLIEDVYELILQKNANAIVYIATSKHSKLARYFHKKSPRTFILNRHNFVRNLFEFINEILKDETFVSIIPEDIIDKKSIPINCFSYNFSDGKFSLAIEKNSPISDDFLEKATTSRKSQSYIRSSEFKELSYLERFDKKYRFTKLYHQMRNEISLLIATLIDESGQPTLEQGQNILKHIESIVDLSTDFISYYGDEHSFLTKFSFPGKGYITHILNSTLFSISLSHFLNFNNWKEMATAALLHDIGVSQIGKISCTSNPFNIPPDQRTLFHSHSQRSIEIIEENRIPVTPRVKEIILNHHENVDGTGFPNGKMGGELSKEIKLFSIIEELDEILTLEKNKESYDFHEAWPELIRRNGPDQFSKRFSDEILQKLAKIFIK